MKTSRRELLGLALAGSALGQNAAKPGRIRLAVSTYSYWHFRTEKYPVEKVIEERRAWGSRGSRFCTGRWPRSRPPT